MQKLLLVFLGIVAPPASADSIGEAPSACQAFGLIAHSHLDPQSLPANAYSFLAKEAPDYIRLGPDEGQKVVLIARSHGWSPKRTVDFVKDVATRTRRRFLSPTQRGELVRIAIDSGAAPAVTARFVALTKSGPGFSPLDNESALQVLRAEKQLRAGRHRPDEVVSEWSTSHRPVPAHPEFEGQKEKAHYYRVLGDGTLEQRVGDTWMDRERLRFDSKGVPKIPDHLHPDEKK